MSTVIRKGIDDQVLDGLMEWRNLHPNEKQWDNFAIAQWLMDNRRWDLEKRLVRKEIARRLARVQNRKRVRNEQSILVREFHAAKLPVSIAGKLVQKTFWAHRSDMTASFAHASFEQRQKQAEGFCKSMSKDAADVNSNNPNIKGNPIQLELDFRYVDKRQMRPQKVQTVPADYGRSLTKKLPR
jgi:hypothetical protein